MIDIDTVNAGLFKTGKGKGQQIEMPKPTTITQKGIGDGEDYMTVKAVAIDPQFILFMKYMYGTDISDIMKVQSEYNEFVSFISKNDPKREESLEKLVEEYKVSKNKNISR